MRKTFYAHIFGLGQKRHDSTKTQAVKPLQVFLLSFFYFCALYKQKQLLKVNTEAEGYANYRPTGGGLFVSWSWSYVLESFHN